MKSLRSPHAETAGSAALLLLLSLTGLHGCAGSAPRAPAPDVTDAGEVRDGVSRQDGHETVVIAGTNDIHGALAPIAFRTKDLEPVEYEKGGAVFLDRHLEILRSRYGGRLLWLDGGDHFQGSIESNAAEGAPMVSFYNLGGLTAAAVGNHEFDFGPAGPEGTAGDPVGALQQRMREAKYPYLAANIVERATGKPPQWPNLRPRLVVQAGGLKVGLIGLSTEETPTTTRIEHVKHLIFQDLRETTLREAKALRAEGAHLVVIVAHSGLRCSPLETPLTHRLRAPNDPSGRCGNDDEMVKLLKGLPTGTVDGVVSGHSHTVVHHWVNGVPVIQGGSRAHHYNLLYLTYDWKQRRARPDLARIEGPVSVCPKVFAYQADCDGERAVNPRMGRGRLVTPSLRGEAIEPSTRMEAALAPVFDASRKEKRRIVGRAAQALPHERTRESPLGNLVADALRWKLGADVAIVNAGGIRAPIEAGEITYEALFRTLPFDNFVSEVRLTGRELKRLVEIAQSGYRGFFPTSGLQLTALDVSLDAPVRDLNGDGKREPWESDRVASLRLAGGGEIRDDQSYRVATIDFLVNGGDDWAWLMRQVPTERKRLAAGPSIRDTLEQYLTHLDGPVNTVERPLVDPAAPRMTVVRSLPKKAKGGGRRRGKRR